MANPAIYRPDPWPQQPVPHVPIPAQGQQPPPGPTQLAVCMSIIRQAWEPPPPQPYQLPLTIAPLTLTYGQQPPPYSIVTTMEVRQAWEPPPPQPWQKPPTQIVSVDNPPPYAPLPANVLRAWQPPDPQPWQRPPTVPIPAQGQTPPAQRFPQEIVSAWQPQWYQAQGTPPNAAWNIPPLIITFVPYAPLQGQIITAWVVPWYSGQAGPNIAPLTLPTGQQPPPLPTLTIQAIPRTWQPPDPPPVQQAPIQLITGLPPPPPPPTPTPSPPPAPPPSPPPPLPPTFAEFEVDDDTERAIIATWNAALNVVPVDDVDDDTEQAIIVTWVAAGNVVLVDVVDDDTERAIVTTWGNNMQLPALFSRNPQTGRLKSLSPGADVQAGGPYAVLDCMQGPRPNERFQQGGTLIRNDYRKVTITVYGVRADVVLAVRAILAVFNRKLGISYLGGAPFSYPSGAVFKAWRPLNDGIIREDDDTKAGKDVWKGIIEGEIWSMRTE